MIIDSHVHLFNWGFFPESWHDATARRWAAEKSPARNPAEIRPHVERGLIDSDGELLRRDMDAAGVDVGVCLTLDWGFALGDQKTPIDEVHQFYAAVQDGVIGQLKGRFLAVAGVDPRRAEAVDLVRHAVTDLGMIGLKLYPPCGYFPYDEACFPLYELCLELDIPVVIHTAVVGYPLRGRFADPLGVGDVQVRYPDLKIVMAHAGYPIWLDHAIEVASRHPGTYLELSNWNEHAAKSPNETIRLLARMRDSVGAHRMLFGSDHLGGPRFGGERSTLPKWVQFIQELPERAHGLGIAFSQEEVALILGQNAARVFNIQMS